MPDQLASPHDVLAAMLATSPHGRVQPDGWRRCALLYAMLVAQARTTNRGRAPSAEIHVGCHELAERLATRERGAKTTGRRCRPDHVSARRILRRLRDCGLLALEILVDEHDQARGHRVRLLEPDHEHLEAHQAGAMSLVARWASERPASWYSPVRRWLADQASAGPRIAARRRRRFRSVHEQGAPPWRGLGPNGPRHSPQRRSGFNVNARRARSGSVFESSESQRLEAPRRPEGHEGRTARLGAVLAALPPSARPSALNHGIGYLSPKEAGKLAAALNRWPAVRSALPALEDLDGDQVLERVARSLVADVTDAGGQIPAGWLTSHERTGQHTPRPAALVARRIRSLIPYARAERQRLREAAAAAAPTPPPLPPWVMTDPAGRPVWKETPTYRHLACIEIPEPNELDRPHVAAQIRVALVADGRHLPRPGTPPQAVSLIDPDGSWALLTLRRHTPELGDPEPGPRHPIVRRRDA